MCVLVNHDLGKAGKVLLLRADMDALPMPERERVRALHAKTGFTTMPVVMIFMQRCFDGSEDLKREKENELEGTVKFMFQSAEETFEGSRNMIEHGSS